MDDEGLYQCVAENEFGDISSPAVLTVVTGILCVMLLNITLNWCLSHS
jgi:hypothetical protein